VSETLPALVAALAGHQPRDERERRSLSRTLALLAWLRDPLDELSDPTHVTGSAVVLDEHRRVLLHRHKRLGLWLQPGGHLEPGESPAQAAVRETLEETGIDAAHPEGGPRLVHVDVHEGPRGHVHLDLRYLLFAAAARPLQPAPGESAEVAWADPDTARRRSDVSLAAALDAALHATLDAAVVPLPGGCTGREVTTPRDGPR
jgi:8-oxo-dGTP pyrophosphatase MutT (NUDIX family)